MEVSKSIVAVLAVVLIVFSIAGTWTVLNSAVAPSSTEHPVGGLVKLFVQEPMEPVSTGGKVTIQVSP